MLGRCGKPELVLLDFHRRVVTIIHTVASARWQDAVFFLLTVSTVSGVLQSYRNIKPLKRFEGFGEKLCGPPG
jgi:hypothetical protein